MLSFCFISVLFQFLFQFHLNYADSLLKSRNSVLLRVLPEMS